MTRPIPAAALARIDHYLTACQPPTPCVVIDLATVRQRYRELAALLPQAAIHYAVKANPAAPVIAALAAEGSRFDLASPGEWARCRSVGVGAERVCFGNTIKREADIAALFALGVDLFAFDSAAELDKLARSAPGARVFCRLAVHGAGAEWPLTRKFGCSPALASDLLLHARRVGLRPAGVSFHVGSQQTDPHQWDIAIGHAAAVFHACGRAGLDLRLLNLGGGLPAHYRAPVPPIEAYVAAMTGSLARHFGAALPDLMIEPGRYMVGDAGLLRARVLLIARHGGHDDRRWVYVDAGRYNGLPETQQEALHYPIRTPHDGGPAEAAVLAGPTCDSTDVIYDRSNVPLPLDLAIDDPVDFLTAGAYTASYAAVEFNGLPPIVTYCL
jgi:ornithine decarboxylase